MNKEDIKQIRRNNFLMPIKKLIRYYDIGFILNNIEPIIMLPPPIINSPESKKNYEENKKIFLQTNETSFKTYQKLTTELESREDIFKTARSINPLFALNMSSKISKEDLDFYVTNVKKLLNKFGDLTTVFKTRNTDYKEQLLLNKDFLSIIIDSSDNSKLAYIEDSFVFSELEALDLSSINDLHLIRKIDEFKTELKRRIETDKL